MLTFNLELARNPKIDYFLTPESNASEVVFLRSTKVSLPIKIFLPLSGNWVPHLGNQGPKFGNRLPHTGNQVPILMISKVFVCKDS